MLNIPDVRTCAASGRKQGWDLFDVIPCHVNSDRWESSKPMRNSLKATPKFAALGFTLLLCRAWVAVAAAVEPEEHPVAFDVAVAITVQSLPSPLDRWFREQADELTKLARSNRKEKTIVDPAPNVPPPFAGLGAGDHFIRLDVAAAGTSFLERRQAARRFPRAAAAAQRLFEQSGVHGGRLPWAIDEHYESLTFSFINNEWNAVLRESALLIHLATDAALPWNVSVRGCESSSVRSKTEDAANPLRDSDWWCRRLDGWRPSSREVRRRDDGVAASSNVVLLENPQAAVFETLSLTFDGWTLMDALAALYVDHLENARDSAVTGPESDHDERLARLAGPLVNGWLENGARLAAGLIITAWHRAGQPPPPDGELPAAPKPTVNAKAPDPAPVDSWIGSLHGTVFHRSSCAHARRIKPDNRVTFSSVQEAIHTGRSPCRSCKPSGP